MPKYFFDTYDRNISQIVTFMTHYYNIRTTTFYNVHVSVKGLKM